MDKINYNIDWSTNFKIDENSPSGLLKIRDYKDCDITPYAVGTKLFNKNKTPLCWIVRFRGSVPVIHRIIWVLSYGSIDPSLVIDHLDGNPFNNHISNLSLKTQVDNTRNARKRKDNTTSISGVYAMTTKEGLKYYIAQWADIDGSKKRKCFSVYKLGEISAKYSAQVHREQQISRLISEGADYTERHGN